MTKKKLTIQGIESVPLKDREAVQELIEELFSDFFDPDKLAPGVVVDLEDKELKCVCNSDLRQEPSGSVNGEVVEFYTCRACERPYMRKAKN